MPVQQRGSKRRNSRSEVAANAAHTPWTASFIRVSLAVNLAVLLAVVPALALFSGADFVAAAWGPPTAARGILLSVYAAILVSSALLLWLYERRADKAAADGTPVTVNNVTINARDLDADQRDKLRNLLLVARANASGEG